MFGSHKTKPGSAKGSVSITTVEEVVANTPGAKYFSVLDAHSGYWQIELDDASSHLYTFNTQWGRYKFTRLPFGIKTVGDIFVEEISKILGDLKGMEVIADDILVYGAGLKEYTK